MADDASGLGAAFGTTKSGIGISGVGIFRPDLIMKVSPPHSTAQLPTSCLSYPYARIYLANICISSQSLIPVVMSGIIAVYSLVIAVIIAGDMAPPPDQNYALLEYAPFPPQ